MANVTAERGTNHTAQIKQEFSVAVLYLAQRYNIPISFEAVSESPGNISFGATFKDQEQKETFLSIIDGILCEPSAIGATA